MRKSSREWIRRVYKPADDDWGIDPDEWEIIRDRVIRRDKSTCQRCDRKLEPVTLTVHHIKPRIDGGTNYITNLITLCSECHDIVECEGLKTKAAILGDNDDPIIDARPIADRNDWHTWVYGGMRKP